MSRLLLSNPAALVLLESSTTTILSGSVSANPGQNIAAWLSVPLYYVGDGASQLPGETVGASYTVTIGAESWTFTDNETADPVYPLQPMNHVVAWSRCSFGFGSVPGAVPITVAVTVQSNTQVGIAASAATLLLDVQSP